MRTGQTARQPDKPHTERPTDIFIRWRPFELLNMFKNCQQIGPDKTDITGIGTHSPHKEMTRNANGQRILLSITRLLALSDKV